MRLIFEQSAKILNVLTWRILRSIVAAAGFLHNQPDFSNVKSILEEHCEKCSFLVLILPKFYCEINPLEMVWGQAKFHYQLYPPSKKEEDLEANVIKALDSVTLNEMQR